LRCSQKVNRCVRSGPRLGDLPGRVIIERKDLLNPLRPPAALIVQHVEGPADLLQPGIALHPGRAGASANAIEDAGQVENSGTRLEKVGVESGAGGQGGERGW